MTDLAAIRTLREWDFLGSANKLYYDQAIDHLEARIALLDEARETLQDVHDAWFGTWARGKLSASMQKVPATLAKFSEGQP